MKALKYLLVGLLLASCAELQTVVFPQSPEAMIAAGASALTATTTVTTIALRNNKITTEQAVGFRGMLGAASTALNDSNKSLLECRAATGSSSTSNPDPCKPKVVDLVKLALDSIANVKRVVDSK